MAVRLRLRRMGRKKRPFYRVVAADQRSPRDGRFIETLGYYNPLTNPHLLDVKEDRVLYWLEKGAQPSDTVKSLLSQKGTILRFTLKKEGKDEEYIQKELAKLTEAQSKKAEKKAKKQEAKKAAKKEVVAEESPEEKAEETTPDASTKDDASGEVSEAVTQDEPAVEEEAPVADSTEEKVEEAPVKEKVEKASAQPAKEEKKDDKEDKKETENGSAE